MRCVFGAGIPFFVLALVWAGAVPSAGAAGPQDISVQESHRKFAAQYVAAVNSQDVERLRRLVHPTSLACITDDNRDVFDDMFARDLRRKLTGPFRVVSVRALDKGAPPALPPAMGAFPIPPTHQIQVDITTGPTSSVTVIRDLRLGDAGWLVVLPCPTAEGLDAFRAAKRTAGEQEARAKVLLAELREPLRSEVEGLLKDGRRVEAMKRYSTASGEDLAMARRVVELLESARR